MGGQGKAAQSREVHLVPLIGLICGLQTQLVQALVGNTQHADEPAIPLQLHPLTAGLRAHCQLLSGGI